MILRLFLLLFTMASATAADSLFYLSSMGGKQTAKGLYTCRLDPATGKLGPITLATAANDPLFLALSPNGRTLYATLVAAPGSVAAYRVEEEKLTLVNEKPSDGAVPCHVGLDSTGRNLFVSNYIGGNIICLRINEDGSLGERTDEFSFSAPEDPAGKKKAHAHGTYADPENRFVYACDLGADNVWTFRFDLAKGALTLADSQEAKVPAGAGPRHLAWHPNGKFVYSANEAGVSVTAFARNAESGALMPLQTLSTVPEGTEPKRLTASEIACHPSGRWLYVSNRGHNSIAVFQIGADGRLILLQDAPAQVEIPTAFAIDPTGQWMIVAGQKDNRITVLKIDADTGLLTPTDQSAQISTPVCVLFGK